MTKMSFETRTYGHDGTVHRNESLDVEVDENGVVVAVWFRCQPLPFIQANVESDRAKEMTSMYHELVPGVVAVVLNED